MFSGPRTRGLLPGREIRSIETLHPAFVRWVLREGFEKLVSSVEVGSYAVFVVATPKQCEKPSSSVTKNSVCP